LADETKPEQTQPAVPVVQVNSQPTLTSLLPDLLKMAVTAPTNLGMFGLLLFGGYLMVTQPPIFLKSIQDGYERIEMRREASDNRRDELLRDLAAAVREQTKHVMGRQYIPTPKKTAPTTNPNIPAPKGPQPDPEVDEEFGPFSFRTHD
jgi:hypothetical protein